MQAKSQFESARHASSLAMLHARDDSSSDGDDDDDEDEIVHRVKRVASPSQMEADHQEMVARLSPRLCAFFNKPASVTAAIEERVNPASWLHVLTHDVFRVLLVERYLVLHPCYVCKELIHYDNPYFALVTQWHQRDQPEHDTIIHICRSCRNKPTFIRALSWCGFCVTATPFEPPSDVPLERLYAHPLDILYPMCISCTEDRSFCEVCGEPIRWRHGREMHSLCSGCRLSARQCIACRAVGHPQWWGYSSFMATDAPTAPGQPLCIDCVQRPMTNPLGILHDAATDDSSSSASHADRCEPDKIE